MTGLLQGNFPFSFLLLHHKLIKTGQQQCSPASRLQTSTGFFTEICFHFPFSVSGAPPGSILCLLIFKAHSCKQQSHNWEHWMISQWLFTADIYSSNQKVSNINTICQLWVSCLFICPISCWLSNSDVFYLWVACVNITFRFTKDKKPLRISTWLWLIPSFSATHPSKYYSRFSNILLCFCPSVIHESKHFIVVFSLLPKGTFCLMCFRALKW